MTADPKKMILCGYEAEGADICVRCDTIPCIPGSINSGLRFIAVLIPLICRLVAVEVPYIHYSFR